jgi:CheY-like chemotaxis protein
VLDTGIGIAPEDQTRLFQSFVQIDSNLNRKYEGTGLGLALVKRLTELHHGQVSLQSQLGQGSCFTVTLPYQPVPGHSPAPQPLAPMTSTFQNDLQAPLVLVVEDNEANILSLKDYLEYKGFSLHCASNGQEALDFLAQQRPDIILMDVQMPIMDGMEASRRIRANPDWQSIPIIALTALTMPGDRERFLAAGMNEHISKPVRLGELVSLIDRLLAATEEPH